MKLPQHSLRELFWLVALVAVALGWALDRKRLSDENVVLAARNKWISGHLMAVAMAGFLKDEGYRVRWVGGKVYVVRPDGSEASITGADARSEDELR